MVYVYLLCFIQHRYQKLHDNLIQSLLHHIRKHGDDAREAAKELVYNYRAATNADITKGGQILKLFTDNGIAGSRLPQIPSAASHNSASAWHTASS
jgi:hypothetical protein